MLVFRKQWALTLEDDDETFLRAIVDIGALAEQRLKLASILSVHPRYPNVAFEVQTVLEAALHLGLRALARDLEREIGNAPG